MYRRPSHWRNSSNKTSSLGSQPDRPVFVLDEDFPESIIRDVLNVATPQLDLWSWKAVDDRLESLQDWRLILALSQLGHRSLITCDERMLESGRVLAVVMQRAFHLVVCTKTGHDAIAATGLLLYNLPHIAKRYKPQAPQIWRLKCAESQPERWKDLRAGLLKRKGTRIEDYELPPEELSAPVLPPKEGRPIPGPYLRPGDGFTES